MAVLGPTPGKGGQAGDGVGEVGIEAVAYPPPVTKVCAIGYVGARLDIESGGSWRRIRRGL